MELKKNSPGLVLLESKRERKITEIGFTRIKPGKKLTVIDSQYQSEKIIIKIDFIKIDVKKIL